MRMYDNHATLLVSSLSLFCLFDALFSKNVNGNVHFKQHGSLSCLSAKQVHKFSTIGSNDYATLNAALRLLRHSFISIQSNSGNRSISWLTKHHATVSYVGFRI